MAATSQFTANSTGYTAVVTQSVCKNVRIIENAGDAGFPTTDILIAKPTASATPVRILGGQSYTFNSPASFFVAGATVGYVKTVSGSITVDQDEDQP